MRRARAPLALATICAITVLLIAAVPIAIPLGGGILTHRTCAAGGLLESTAIWTPLLIVNAPQHAWARGQVTGLGFDTGALNVSNGEVMVEMANLTWTFYSSTTKLVVGAGFDAPCQGPVIADYASGPLDTRDCELQAAVNQSDQNLSTAVPVVGCAFLGSNDAAVFSDTYDSVACPTLQGTDCWFVQNGAGELISGNVYGNASLPFLLPLAIDGSTTWVSYVLPAQMTVAYYMDIPGCWHYQALGQAPPAIGWYAWGQFVNTTAHPNTCGSTFG